MHSIKQIWQKSVHTDIIIIEVLLVKVSGQSCMFNSQWVTEQCYIFKCVIQDSCVNLRISVFHYCLMTVLLPG